MPGPAAPAATDPPPAPGPSPVPLLYLALLLTTLLVYVRVLSYDFINYDDPDYVVRNPHVAAGLSAAGVRWAFTTFACANWHPLTWLSLELDRDLYGGLRPGGFHATNLALHLLNVALLFHVLRRLTGAVWRSALVAALFAWHPLHVESVAWVSERKDVLSTLFWLLTLWAYAGYAARPGPGRYGLVVLAFALGLLAKPMLVTLPCVLLLLDYWPLRRWGAPGRLGAEKLPLLALSAASCVVTLHAQAHGRTIGSLEHFPAHVRFLNAVSAYAVYLRKTVWPADLAVYYPYAGVDLSYAHALAAGAALLAVTAGVLWAARRRPYLAVGWFWYLGTLVPVIGLVQVGSQALADRYTYVPLIGIFLAVAWAAGDLVETTRREGVQTGVKLGAAAALAACVVGTCNQLGTWRDARAVWEQALRVSPDYFLLHDYLGHAYLEAGELVPARRHFARAVALNPDSARSRTDLGAACLSLGDLAEAERQLSEALRLNPRHARARYNRALANLLRPEPDLPAALEDARQAVAADPDLAPARYLLAYLCQESGRREEAAEHYAAALRRDPQWPEAADANARQLLRSTVPAPWKAALALVFARQACQATGGRRGAFLETWSAAAAAAGRDAEAEEALRRAVALASERGDSERARALRERLQLYDSRRP